MDAPYPVLTENATADMVVKITKANGDVKVTELSDAAISS